MSFSDRVKKEICRNKVFRQKGKEAMAYGLLLFGRSFGEESVSIHTEHRSVARLYVDLVSDFTGLTGSITTREIERPDRRSIYQVTVDTPSDRRAVLARFGVDRGTPHIREDFLSPELAAAFLSGAFLACGAVSDPEKDYRVELMTPYRTLCDELGQLLSGLLSAPKITVRRNHYLLYYKESEAIEDLLTLVGAPKSSMELMEIKMVKELRNKVNRETNCETANISKTVDAAMGQIAEIQFIEDSCGLDSLDEELRRLARLRRDNPEMSLRELSLLLGISRSGVNHRLKRIMEFAERLRTADS